MEVGEKDPERMTIEDFPRWQDRRCSHPSDRQQRDGMGTICLDCGIIQVLWR